MIPGVNPRQLKQMMKQMGMSQDDLDVSKLTIELKTGEILVFENPGVQKVTMQGQISFQVTGDYSTEEKKVEIKISKDDIDMVVEQAQVSKDEAMKALENSNGDIAEAIINLQN